MRLARFLGPTTAGRPNGVRYGQVEDPLSEGESLRPTADASRPGRPGRVEGDRVREIRGSIYRAHQLTGNVYPLSGVRLLAPCEPPKMLAVGLPTAGRPELQEPPGGSARHQGPGDVLQGHILHHRAQGQYHPAPPLQAGRLRARLPSGRGEMVVVMKRRCRNVARRTALSYVLGYTCGNDVSARDWQAHDRHLWRAKSADTFSPFGPWIETEVDPSDLRLITRLNGAVVQDTRTSLMMHDVPTIISWVSQVLTLEPGDVIFTGTSGATKPMSPGDVVEVELEKVGTLRNPVVAQGSTR